MQKKMYATQQTQNKGLHNEDKLFVYPWWYECHMYFKIYFILSQNTRLLHSPKELYSV